MRIQILIRMEIIKSLKSIYKDAKIKRSSREKVFSNHKEKEFQQRKFMSYQKLIVGFWVK